MTALVTVHRPYFTDSPVDPAWLNYIPPLIINSAHLGWVEIFNGSFSDRRSSIQGIDSAAFDRVSWQLIFRASTV